MKKEEKLGRNNSTMDPLEEIHGPMTRARKKKMQEALKEIISSAHSKDLLKIHENKPNCINYLVLLG